MKIGNAIQQKLILFFVRPFSKEKQIEYKTTLKKATRVLILYPYTETALFDKTLSSLKGIFPEAGFAVLYTGVGMLQSKKHPDAVISALNLPKQTYRSLSRSVLLKQILRKRFDILLDLDAKYSLLSFYLCRSIGATIRIGFNKPYGDKFYNFQYRAKPDTPHAQKLNGLLQFLKAFVVS